MHNTTKLLRSRLIKKNSEFISYLQAFSKVVQNYEMSELFWDIMTFAT